MSYTDEQRAIDYKVVFGTPDGRRVLTDILIKGHVWMPITTTDPIEAARVEGARQLALHIASFDRFDADKFKAAWRDPEDAT